MKYSRKTFLPKEKQKEIIKRSLKERDYIEGTIPITGRSLQNYSIQLFPDINQSSIVNYLKQKDYLDIACGINHLYPKSLLRTLTGSKKRHGLDIHDQQQTDKTTVKYFKGSIFKTSFPDNSYDCITINNFLYFWENNNQKLLGAYKELNRILKKNGILRIFPVFFGNYYNDSVELYDYLNANF